VQPTGGERVHSRQGEDRKATLLRHAEALFEERGFNDTRMIDIARSAGVAKGLCYWYFDSKEALFREIIVDMRERLRATQRAATSILDEPLAVIYVGTFVSVGFMAQHSHIYGLMSHVVMAPTYAGTVAESYQMHANDTADVLAEGQRRGSVRSDQDPLALALGNAGVVNHAVGSYATGVIADRSLDDVAHFAAGYVLHAVAASDDHAAKVLVAHGPGAHGSGSGSGARRAGREPDGGAARAPDAPRAAATGVPPAAAAEATATDAADAADATAGVEAEGV
jgi:AcrR family transcriptional regulator